MQEAADLLGITQPTVSRIESGDHLPNPKTIAKLSDATEGVITAPDLYKHWAAKREAAE